MTDISAVQSVIGESEPLVIAMSYASALILDKSTELSKNLQVQSFTQGGIELKVKAINGIPIVRVPTARFKTEYTFYDGSSGGQTAGGFVAGSLAANMNWQILHRRAPIAVSKQDKMRIFDPDTNQKADAWKIDYRRYHDIWIPDNKLNAIYVNYTGIASPALEATVAAGTAAGTKFTATAGSGNTLAYKLSATEISTPNYLSIPTDVTAYTSGADIAAATEGQYIGCYELNSDSRVVKFFTQVLESSDIYS